MLYRKLVYSLFPLFHFCVKALLPVGLEGEQRLFEPFSLFTLYKNGEKLGLWQNFCTFVSMATVKPKKETIVNEMITELDFGMDRAECWATIGKKWQLAKRTFDRYWKEARSRFQALNLKAQKAKEEVYIQEEKKAAKKAILNKHQRQEILTQIALGQIPLKKHIVCDGTIVEKDIVPSWTDRKAAIAELNKMDGDYAPTKKDITSGGEPIKQITGIIVE